MASFGSRIRELRRVLGLTQWQVAEKTGVSNTYISALESGRKPAPPHAIVAALAACLETDEDALWNLARMEREERLRRRIDGIPTSQRRSRKPVLNSDSALPDDSLTRAFLALNESAQDPKQRRSLADALELLANSLRGKS